MRIARLMTGCSTDVTLATAIRLRKKRSLVEELTDSGHVCDSEVRNGRKFELQTAMISSRNFLRRLAKHLTQDVRRRSSPAHVAGRAVGTVVRLARTHDGAATLPEGERTGC